MKVFLLVFVTSLFGWSASSLASSNQYNLRVDGLACPFCAYGIEKEFTRTKGVVKVDIDMVNGLVIVTTSTDKTFAEAELSEIINNAGFTMKSMSQAGH